MKPVASGSTPIRTRAWPSWPVADRDTQQLLSDVLASGRWAISGPNAGTPSCNRRFQEAFARYHDVPYCVAVSNGSAAIRIALESLDVGWGHEVLVPGLTWVACASAVAAGERRSGLRGCRSGRSACPPDRAEAITDQTRAILIVHAFCTVADIDAFRGPPRPPAFRSSRTARRPTRHLPAPARRHVRRRRVQHAADEGAHVRRGEAPRSPPTPPSTIACNSCVRQRRR